MKRYDPKSIEPKWQAVWADTKLYRAIDDDPRQKYYYMVEFPYPSGEGLHVGHVLSYTALDIMARHKRMQGFNVMYPMGFDEFGLPTENYAIKHKIAPQAATAANVATFTKQMKGLGLSFDWDRQVHTSDPKYYRWTQWIFLQLLKHDLAYQDEIAINWCPFEKTGLANEEVVDGKHERCGTPVEKKLLKQWLLRITSYADRLIDDLKTVDYPDRIASQQVNWIGRSEGAEIDFEAAGEKITVYTTRADTLGGATFLVLAPEHSAVKKIASDKQKSAVEQYIKHTQAESEVARQETDRKKTGVWTGATARNPITGDDMPVWIADYVLAGYGTGAIMAVPAHDQRDFEFAKTFDLPIKQVVAPNFGEILPDAVDVTGPVVIGYDPETKQFMSLINTKNNMRWLASGGLEDGEDYVTAARRELAEEAGFTTVTKLIQLGGPTYSYYFNPNKHSNRRSFSYLFLAIISAKDQGKQALESHENFEVAWSSLDEILADFHKEPDGRGHWIDGMVRAGDAAAAYDAGRDYDGPVFTGDGTLINSGQFDGLVGDAARHDIIKWLFDKGIGRGATKYKLRDWIFSRQHYWGEPIPVIHCPKDGVVPVPDDQLPVELPVVESYEPTDTGESPLAAMTDWVNVDCPKCGGAAKRETDTMPNWAGSSWYWLRYTDPDNDQVFAAPDKLKYWTPVDLYNGGMEHTTLHLLYSRFWHKFLYDQGLVPTAEPYAARRSHGMILGPDGVKMSKSRGNVINPDEVVKRYGADTIRTYEMFMGPYEDQKAWSDEHLAGVSRFLYRVWALAQDLMTAHGHTPGPISEGSGVLATAVDRTTHKTIKKVHDDIEGMAFNTMVSALMEYVNFLTEAKIKADLLAPTEAALAWRTLRTLVLLIAPIAPHMAEELWHELGEAGSVHAAAWPAYDPKLVKDDIVTIVVQVNGKVRANIVMDVAASDDEVTAAAKADDKVARHLAEGKIVKTIVVPRKLINFVVK